MTRTATLVAIILSRVLAKLPFFSREAAVAELVPMLADADVYNNFLDGLGTLLDGGELGGRVGGVSAASVDSTTRRTAASWPPSIGAEE